MKAIKTISINATANNNPTAEITYLSFRCLIRVDKVVCELKHTYRLRSKATSELGTVLIPTTFLTDQLLLSSMHGHSQTKLFTFRLESGPSLTPPEIASLDFREGPDPSNPPGISTSVRNTSCKDISDVCLILTFEVTGLVKVRSNTQHWVFSSVNFETLRRVSRP